VILPVAITPPLFAPWLWQVNGRVALRRMPGSRPVVAGRADQAIE